MSALAAAKRLHASASEGGLSMNSRLSESRREKLISLKKREDLKDALTDKFKGRFGTGSQQRPEDEVSVSSTAIRREVDHFASSADVTENNLGRLERRIQNKARNEAPGTEQGSVVSKCTKVSAYSGASRLSQSRSVASLAGQSVMKGGADLKPGTLDWARLDEYASFLHEQDALRQKQGVAALQRKMRLDLDRQVAERNARKDDGAEEDRRYHSNLMVELDRWKQTEQSRSEEHKSKLMREKRDRDDQLAYEKSLKEAQLEKKKVEEKQSVGKIVQEMETEQKRFEKKKQDTKAAMRKVFDQNEQDQMVKKEAKRVQAEREGEQIREYNRILDEQEESRAEEMQARMVKQKELMDKLQANVQAQVQESGDNDALRARKQADEIHKHQAEGERVKQDRLKQMRMENKAFLQRQMHEKAGRGSDDKELQEIQAMILRRDSDEYAEIERQKVINRKVRNFEHRQEVEQQMAVKAQVYVPEMSEAEVRMNRGLLSLVQNTLQQRDDGVIATRGEEAYA